MIVLITGGAGFLGSHIADRLVRECATVRVLDPSPAKSVRLRLVAGHVDTITGDFRDEVLLQKCLQGVDVLLHFAGSTLPAASNTDPTADVLTNLAANVRLFNQAAVNGVTKIIFPSSGGTVYGIPQSVPVPECAACDPISSYGIVKLATEKYLSLFERLYGTRFVALRFSNPYGEGQDPFRKFGVIASFLGAVLAHGPMEIWGDGKSVRDFVYIEDAVESVMRAMEYDGPERVVNVGSGVGTTIRDVANLVQEITGSRSELVFMPSRVSDVPAVVLDISRAEQSLGWVPRTELRTGIERTWKWLTTGRTEFRNGEPSPGIHHADIVAKRVVSP